MKLSELEKTNKKAIFTSYKDDGLALSEESPQEVERRFKAYDNDIQHWKDYDHIIINDNLENCYKQIENIILINKLFLFPELSIDFISLGSKDNLIGLTFLVRLTSDKE